MMLTAAARDRLPIPISSPGLRRATPLDVLAGELSDATAASAVWRALFRHARATTSADSILVALYDSERQQRACVYFAEGDAEEDVSVLPPMPLNDGPQSRAVLTGEPVVTDDLTTALKGLPQVHVGIDDERRLTKSSLAVPMRARGAVIGVAELQSYERAAFSPRDETVVGRAVAMAALASDGLRVPSSARHRAERRAARERVARIIADGAFQPVYQPIADLSTEGVVGYEALTRFADGTAPDEHFARAEACGLGLELEAATLRAALDGAEELPSEAWLALNVSPRLVLSRQPLRDLIACERRRIVLEITEHAAIDDYPLFRHALRRLPRRIELAIDDAGAGYASFRHIFELRPAFVKLSREFIRGIDRDPARQALVRGLAEVAVARGSLLVAEGLETEAELAAVRGLGVPLGQGFLLGRPAAVEVWSSALGAPDQPVRRAKRRRSAPIASPSTSMPIGRSASPGRKAIGDRLPEPAMLLELIATGSSLTEALAAITGWVEAQSRGMLSSILLLDSEGRLRHGSAPSLPPAYNAAIDGIAIGPDVGSCGTAAHLGQQVVVRDIATDPRWARYRELALEHGLRACWSTPIRAADGRVLGTFAMYYRSPRTPTPRQLGLIATATHLASLAIERDAAERRMADLAHLNEMLLGSAGEGLYAVDLEGRVTLVNPAAARMLGWQAAELLGQRMHDLIHHTKPDGSPFPYEECPTATAGTETAEELFWRRDGTSFPVECTATPLIERGDVVGSAITFHDITHRRRLTEDLRQARSEVERLLADERGLRVAAQESEQRFRELVQGLDAVVWEADGVSYQTTFVSQRARDLLGYPAEEYLADPAFWESHLHPDDRDRAIAACEAAIRELGDVSLEYRFRAADGRYLWIADRVRVTSDATGHGRRLTGVMIDISERKRLEEELARQAFEDALTGLPNRALFMDRVGHALAASPRRKRRVAVLFIDIDGLKLINDTLGHEAGDGVLREAGRRLKAASRAADTVARLAGDEFTVLIEDLPSNGDVREVAARFAARLRAPLLVAGREMSVTASFGIALSEPDLRDPEELVRRADIAMYRAKRGGKDRVVMYEEAMGAHAWARLDVELELLLAVERREFTVVYQPIVDLPTGRIVEVEALVRWQHPARGLLAPSEFIALAEETGLIVPIGAFVLEEACRQVRAWQVSADPALALSVNLSARQFQEPQLVEEVAAVLERTGVAPASLRLEITESVMLNDSTGAGDTMQALRDLGVGVVVDDFGTGYSSLGYLKRFPLDGIKIDRSFISGLGESPEDGVIVTAAIAIGRAFNLRVTAEGIENEGQLNELRRLECDQAQGFWFSRPLDADAMGHLMRDGELGEAPPLHRRPVAQPRAARR